MTTVAYQGEPGAYSEDAVRRVFDDAEAQPQPSVREVFERVEVGATGYGVVPLENSQAGSINETYDLLVRHGVRILGEVVIRVNHALLALPDVQMGDLARVISHPQALAQCEEFLVDLGVETSPVHDTAGAARRVAEDGDPKQAAIAGRRAAEIHGLEVLAENIQTYPENFTKFAVVGHEPPEGWHAPDKTSIVFAVSDVPGSLHACLAGFAAEGINLIKIESRPQGGRPWRYLIYLDFEMGAEEPPARKALEVLSDHTSFVRVLGSYPAWDEA